MALPFLLGVAVGAGAVVAYKNKDKILNKTNETFGKSKDLASEAKKSMDATVDCIKDRMQQTEEKEEKEKEEVLNDEQTTSQKVSQ